MKNGALAQAVEHLTFNQVVAGSNPACFNESIPASYMTCRFFIFEDYCKCQILLQDFRIICRTSESFAGLIPGEESWHASLLFSRENAIMHVVHRYGRLGETTIELFGKGSRRFLLQYGGSI